MFRILMTFFVVVFAVVHLLCRTVRDSRLGAELAARVLVPESFVNKVHRDSVRMIDLFGFKYVE